MSYLFDYQFSEQKTLVFWGFFLTNSRGCKLLVRNKAGGLWLPYYFVTWELTSEIRSFIACLSSWTSARLQWKWISKLLKLFRGKLCHIFSITNQIKTNIFCHKFNLSKTTFGQNDSIAWQQDISCQMVNILRGITKSISTLDFSQHQLKFHQCCVDMYVGLKILTNAIKWLLYCRYKIYPTSTIIQFTPAFVINLSKKFKHHKELSARPGLNCIMHQYGVLN